jgi:hypothetical protein
MNYFERFKSLPKEILFIIRGRSPEEQRKRLLQKFAGIYDRGKRFKGNIRTTEAPSTFQYGVNLFNQDAQRVANELRALPNTGPQPKDAKLEEEIPVFESDPLV